MPHPPNPHPAPFQCVFPVFDLSSLHQPQLLDIQIWLHLFLFPLQRMGTSDSLTIRCYYFPFFFPPPQTPLHTPHMNLVLIEEVTTVVTKLCRQAGIQIDTFWGRKKKSVERVGFEKLCRFKTSCSSLGHPPSVMPSLVISVCQSAENQKKKKKAPVFTLNAPACDKILIWADHFIYGSYLQR